MVESIIIGRDKPDIEKYGEKCTAFIGKHIVGSGDDAHLTNPVLLDLVKPHVMLICGKRGTGKCVEENTLVVLEDGSVVPIKDLENDSRKVMGLDKSLKIKGLMKTDFYKRKVSKLLYIRTRSGREIKLTHEHPLLTVTGWLPVKDLTIGSRIATPRKIDVFKGLKIDDSKVKILAYIIAEGHISNGFVLFSNTDQHIFEDFKESINDFDQSLRIVEHSKAHCYRITKSESAIEKSHKERGYSGRFVSRKSSLEKWLIDIGIYGKLSKYKFIPKCVFDLSKSQMALFLNRLFSCDGSIYTHNTHHAIELEISYASISEILIKQVQHMLLRFSVLSKLRRKKTKCNNKVFNTFELVINRENAEKFIEEIGFYGEKKEKQGVFLKRVKNKAKNPNLDTIPKEIWDIYRPKSWVDVGIKFDYAFPKALRESIKYSPSRQKLLQIAKFDNNDPIYKLANSDIFWDEITFIEELEGDFNVCDITIPDFHNFVASDIIVHNSYSGAVIAEGIALLPEDIKQNLSVIMIDTMGIFWSMKNPNEKDRSLLKQWKMEPKGLKTKLFVPQKFIKEYKDIGVKVDFPLALSCGELEAADWIVTFGFSPIDSYGIAVDDVIKTLKDNMGNDYTLVDIIKAIKKDKEIEADTKRVLLNRFEAAESWGVFEKEGTSVSGMFEPGTVNVIDVSHFMRLSGSWSIRSLLVGLLSRKIFMERLKARKSEEFEDITGEKKKKVPMVWLIMDEAHQFLNSSYDTAATEPLLTLIKEGRQPGISVLMITQRPGKMHEDALAQSDLIIAHRLTARADIEALRSIMQTYMLEDITEYISELPRNTGSAVILDDNSERLFAVQIRPRISWHAGGSAEAVKEKGLF